MDQKTVYDFDSVISRAGTHAEKYEARQRFFGSADVEPFWVADMDLPSPAFVQDALRSRIDHPMFGYTEQYDSIFDAIGWWMADQHGASVEREWISLSPSVVTSLSIAVQALTEPGDAVALLSPVYGPFFSCVQANGRRVADCPLGIVQGRFEIDWIVLERELMRPETALLLLSNPHNPGGRVWSAQELRRIASLCTAHGVTIFSDEIHCDIVYAPHRHTSMLTLDEARPVSLVAHSIGKTFNASGLQASFAVIPDPALRARFRAGLNRAHAGDVNLLGKAALAAALSPAGAEYKRQLTAYLHENTRQVCAALRRLNALGVMEPEATFLVWCDFRAFGDWPAVFRRLTHDAGVALSGGTFFGPAGEGWFRINCAHPRSRLLPAVERIVAEFSG
jgi:cystathionine beta-lyase